MDRAGESAAPGLRAVVVAAVTGPLRSPQMISLLDLVRYCVSVCNQIASHLHICVFKIKPCSPLSSASH